jgi:hypothetical protein
MGQVEIRPSPGAIKCLKLVKLLSYKYDFSYDYFMHDGPSIKMNNRIVLTLNYAKDCLVVYDFVDDILLHFDYTKITEIMEKYYERNEARL